MFCQSATFTLTITGLNATNFAELTDVVFGYGPDGPGRPDEDDIGRGTLSTAPEPASFGLIGIGLCGIGLIGRRLRSR